MNRVFYKDRAKAMLKGKWVLAILVALVFLIATGDTIINKRVDTNIDFQNLQGNMNSTMIMENLPFKNALGSYYSRFVNNALLPIGGLVFIVGMLLQAMLLNPLVVGLLNFFRLTDMGLEAGMDEILFPFRSPHYKNIVKIMFFRDIKILLWTLLLIIPGIIKGIEYTFIPWMLSENPGMEMTDAFAYTRQLTDGRKMDLFVLGLSFIGWAILVAVSFGILSPVLYAYVLATEAAVYNSFSGRTEPEPAYA